MRAVLIERPGKVAVTSVADPTPGDRQVVVEVAAVGICGTDLHIFDGDFEPTPYPIIPGHEFAGTVVAVGPGVTEIAEGDRVAVDPSLFCGECHYCKIGRGNLCERWGAIGVTSSGGCAEYAVAPVANCYRLPDHVPLEHAALIEPLSCAVHGYDLLPSRLGEHYLIYGAGTMGLLMAQLAGRAGAASVSVVDLDEARLNTAAKLGADAIGTSADVFDRPDGWEVVVDCTGAVAVIEDAIGRVRRGGTFQVFGVAAAEATARFSPFRVYKDEITIVGSMAVLHSFDRAVELMAQGAVDAATMISHSYSLDDYSTALTAFRDRVGRKLQVRPATP
ncbi:MAG TPA: zinc-dependent alcohol dehydrogenase family protein [Jiangellaceae bacterium]